ncbi:NAD-dependent epimerase/dehydratase family protein [Candidatus Latescibacterota bacterium]
MKVLITGGAGFIGSHLADKLVARSDDVLIIDNLTTGQTVNIADNEHLTYVEDDIADTDVVNKAFDEFTPDVVIHAAASYKDPDNWVRDTKTNVLGAANIIKACQRTGVSRLIYFQTALCYGLHPEQQPIKVDHPLDPSNSSYAISKTAGEQYIRSSGLDYISFRLANIIGPRNISGPVPIFYKRLSEKLTCFVTDTRRDFVFVKDLVEVVIKSVDGCGECGVYHISSGGDYAIKELFDAVVTAMGIKLDRDIDVRPPSSDDASTILLDPSKTERDFVWQASTPLETTIREAVDWYRQYGVEQAYTHLKVGKEEKRS